MFGCVAGLMFSTSASEPVEPDCVLVEHVEQQEVGLFTVEAFPREFTGSFLWDTDQTPRNEQSVRYTIDSVSERGEILLATGTGSVVYTNFPNIPAVTFDLRVEIDRSRGTFEMWESNPSREENYTVDGKYVGHVDALDATAGSLSMRWLGDDGNHGTLVLRGLTSPGAEVVIR